MHLPSQIFFHPMPSILMIRFKLVSINWSLLRSAWFLPCLFSVQVLKKPKVWCWCGSSLIGDDPGSSDEAEEGTAEGWEVGSWHQKRENFLEGGKRLFLMDFWVRSWHNHLSSCPNREEAPSSCCLSLNESRCHFICSLLCHFPVKVGAREWICFKHTQSFRIQCEDWLYGESVLLCSVASVMSNTLQPSGL